MNKEQEAAMELELQELEELESKEVKHKNYKRVYIDKNIENTSNFLTVANYSVVTWQTKFPNLNIDLNTLPINTTWEPFFKQKQSQKQIRKINDYLTEKFKKNNGVYNVYPYPDLVFSALNSTPLNRIKVVILGQDPYHDAFYCESTDKIIPQAMGLSFSVPIGIEKPPSLKNIFKNQLAFNQIISEPTHGNLITWAYQGCLMLNTSLTVMRKNANSHSEIWTPLTDDLIRYISDNTQNVVFVLWGGPALEKYGLIDNTKHKIIVTSHPSGLSVSNKLRGNPAFKDYDHFGKINEYLKIYKKSPIVWQIK